MKARTNRVLKLSDQLTGVYNRYFYEKQLKEVDKESNLPLTIAMLYVNGLKLFNDAFGHHMGDMLLKNVSEVLIKVSREKDNVARVGGDEFLLLFPKTSSEDTEKVINEIYEEIEKIRLKNVIVSVSIGWDTKIYKEQELREIYAKAEDHMYRKKITESQSMRSKTIKVILDTLNETNYREKIHSEKVSELSNKIGNAMGLNQQILKELEIAGLMHDIGKIGVSKQLLEKPEKLDKEEYEDIKKHTKIGYHILKSVDTYSTLADYVLSHHEHWDGTGYPRGLAGEDISLISRIITIADVYEAMTSVRPY